MGWLGGDDAGRVMKCRVCSPASGGTLRGGTLCILLAAASGTSGRESVRLQSMQTSAKGAGSWWAEIEFGHAPWQKLTSSAST
jgi:hypothetical protein